MSDENIDDITVETAAVPDFSGVEVRQPGYSLYLQIPDNYMECRCSYLPHEEGSTLTVTELADILTEYNVVYGIDQEALEDFVAGAVAGRRQQDILLASGTPPVNGTDGCFALSAPTSTAVKRGNDDVSSDDMCNVKTFVNISDGEEIGRIIPADSGTPGQNIMGVPIPPLPGKPLNCKIGKNISAIEVKQPGYSLYLLIPDNHMECRCSYLPHEEGSMLTSWELADILTEYKVVYGIDQGALEDFVAGAAAGRQQHNVLLAAGTPPVDGTDGYFALSVPPSAVVKSGNTDVRRVDMYIVQTFVNVSNLSLIHI